MSGWSAHAWLMAGQLPGQRGFGEGRDGYNFEHNFGHGNNHPADVFATLAFLIDQVQQHCCPLFGKAREHRERILSLWDRMRSLLQNLRITDWQTFYLACQGR